LKQKIEDILSCEVRNEIKIHKTLHHQNIVELREVFEDDRNLYIMLELCENGVISSINLES
jgi:serine/threonine protein kinase